MTQQNEDDLLREAFRDLGNDVRRRGAVPDVHAMLERARAEAEEDSAGAASPRLQQASGPPRLGRAAWLPLAAAAAVVALMLMDGGSSSADREFERLVSSYSSDVAAGAWRSPTDALLRTPGLDLGAVPTFGPSLGGLSPRPDTPQEPAPGRDS